VTRVLFQFYAFKIKVQTEWKRNSLKSASAFCNSSANRVLYQTSSDILALPNLLSFVRLHPV
jgi:hypothetical protein